MNLREKLSLIPAIVIGGIRLWVDPPRRLKLKVDHDYEARRERERREMEECFGDLSRRKAAPRNARPMPPLKCIHMDHPYRAYGRDCAAQMRVAINLVTRRLDWTYTDSVLFGREHNSGTIGVALFSLPITLPLSPILILVRRYYEWQEKRRGMSRHGHALLRSLRGQLDRETEALLTEALKNTWKYEQAMSRRVSLEEAKTILAGCELRETAIDKNASLDAGYRGFHWFDDQENYVADGSFYNEGSHSIRVLGSTFKDAEADALADCYRSREVKVYGDKD